MPLGMTPSASSLNRLPLILCVYVCVVSGCVRLSGSHGQCLRNVLFSLTSWNLPYWAVIAYRLSGSSGRDGGGEGRGGVYQLLLSTWALVGLMAGQHYFPTHWQHRVYAFSHSKASFSPMEWETCVWDRVNGWTRVSVLISGLLGTYFKIIVI